jgi:hypothetical protein
MEILTSTILIVVAVGILYTMYSIIKKVKDDDDD